MEPTKMTKDAVRLDFRNKCFERDEYQCRMCGYKPDSLKFSDCQLPLDCHHITDRHLMPYGGYVLENGISLCLKCHELAEMFHAFGNAYPGFHPSDLYAKINSDHDSAYHQSLLLGDDKPGLTPAGYTHSLGTWLWVNIKRIKSIEMVVLAQFHDFGDNQASDVSWILACEEDGETDPRILLYGKGRC